MQQSYVPCYLSNNVLAQSSVPNYLPNKQVLAQSSATNFCHSLPWKTPLVLSNRRMKDWASSPLYFSPSNQIRICASLYIYLPCCHPAKVPAFYTVSVSDGLYRLFWRARMELSNKIVKIIHGSIGLNILQWNLPIHGLAKMTAALIMCGPILPSISTHSGSADSIIIQAAEAWMSIIQSTELIG